MRVRLLDDTHAFSEAARPFLTSEPFSANVLAVEVDRIVRSVRPTRPGSLWILVEDDSGVVGAAMHTPPWHLFLPRLGSGLPEAIAGALAEAGRDLPGATGETGTVGRFGAAWISLTGQSSRRRLAERMYVLGELRPPEAVEGAARMAAERDVDLVATWFDDFTDEANPSAPREEVAAVAARIEAGTLFLWEVDGVPVSLAGVSAPALGVARVGPVFTPREQRRHGYGAAVTAAVSTAALAGGSSHVVLYTDLANPISNSIYQKIGYRPDHDAEQLDFFPGGERPDPLGV